jgi:hypothetical protein
VSATLQLVRQCACCEQSAIASCLRCSAPLCEDHQPADRFRCVDCERVYRQHRTRRMAGHAAVLIATSFALSLVLMALVLATAGGALGVAPLILMSSFPVILSRLELRARRRFLAERPTLSLPAARVLVPAGRRHAAP